MYSNVKNINITVILICFCHSLYSISGQGNIAFKQSLLKTLFSLTYISIIEAEVVCRALYV